MPCIGALSAALLAGSVRTTRCGTASSRTAAIAGVSSLSIGGMIRGARGPRCPDVLWPLRGDRGSPGSPAWRSRLLGLALARGVPLVALGERTHELAQEAVQLLALGRGQHRRDPPLSLGLRADGALPGRMAFLGGLDELATTVRRVGQPTD